MILVAFVLLSAAVVPLARGRLMKLASLRFRRMWVLLIAMGLQLPLITITGPRTGLREAAYIASFVLGGAFLFENRRIPGMWLVGLGTAMNLAAIAANGGVMPASPHALAAAGLPIGPSHTYINSMALSSPKLIFLGDIFAIPQSWPLSNVFSAGDVCIAFGAAVAIHRISGSRLLPSGRGQFAPLVRRPTFMALWSAQVISNLGDWTYALAVAATLVNRTHSPQALSLLLVAQVAPAAVLGGMLSALPDRHSRIALMIGADLVRAAAVASLFIGSPTEAHIYMVAALLGIFGALFQPSLRAAIPNVVEEGQVVAANAMVGATFNFAVLAGPAIGGILMARLGATPVFAINAGSFVLSALLIAAIRLPRPTRSAGRRRSAYRDVVTGARYAMHTPLVHGMLVVIGLVLVAAASKAPLESLFVLGTLSLGPEALGLIMGSWGLGMLFGSVAAPAICRRWDREQVLAIMIALVGTCTLLAAQARDLETVLLAWLVAGGANSIANVAYESVLQERTPDELRGRVFAAFQFVRNVAFLTGAFLAGWVGSHLGVRLDYVFSGTLFLIAAVVCWFVLPGSRRAKVREAVLVGFGRGAGAVGEDVSETESITVPAVPPAPVEPMVVSASALGSSDSVFTGSGSVFALAERESERAESAVFERPFSARSAFAENDLHEQDGWVAPRSEPAPESVKVVSPVRPEPMPEHEDPAALLSSFDPDDRLRGVELASNLMHDPAVAMIMKALSDPAAQVRRRAVLEVGNLGLTEAIPDLDHALDDPDEDVRFTAVQSLGRMDDDRVLPLLVEALKDPSDRVRTPAAAALVQRQSDHVVTLLGQALASRPLRAAALDVLSRIGTPAVEPLVDLLADVNGLRPALGDALSRTAGVTAFSEELSSLEPARRSRAVEALGAIGGREAVQSLLRALNDPEPEIRTRAAALLGELGDPAAIEDLDRATEDPVEDVAAAARAALASLHAEEPALA